MKRWLLTLLVGAALVAGIVVSAVAFSLGGSFGDPPDVLVVRVTNTGSHEAAFEVEVGGRFERWEYLLAPGETREDRVDDPPRGQVPVTVRASWSAPADTGEGTARKVADGRSCPGGMLVVSFRVDTTIGVAIETTAHCA